MNIHEYQAKELLAKFGVAVPKGIAALSVEEAVAAAKQLPGPLYVVKSQIHAGGRGKGKFKELGPDAKGGVRLAKSIEEVEAHAKEMLGNTLVTIQTGPEGKQVNRLYITDGADIKQEFYLALLVDRATSRIAVVARRPRLDFIQTEPNRVADRRRYGDAAITLIVTLNDFPWRQSGAGFHQGALGSADKLAIHFPVPPVAFRNLPMQQRTLFQFAQPFLLSVFRQVHPKFQDQRAIIG